MRTLGNKAIHRPKLAYRRIPRHGGYCGKVVARLEVRAAMKVIADRQKCCSSGMCVVRAPDVFTQNEADGVVEVLQENPGSALYRAVKDAAEACPVQAIRIEE